MKKYNTIIIGGGASGCMVAMSTKENVLLLDSGKSLAKKLMVTGNGRCNITNTNISSNYYNQNIDKYLQRFNEKQTIDFFESIGLETYADEEGRVYPISNSAKSVVDVICSKLKNIEALFGQKVVDIKKQKDGYVVYTEGEVFGCKNLVVSTGGNSLFGAIKNFGVDIKPFVPSLVSLKSPEIKDLNGVRVSNVLVTANVCCVSKSELGEVLFKDGGLSGIVIFNLSTLLARNNNFEGTIYIDLLPKLSIDDLCQKLENRKKLNVKLDKFFVGMFVNNLANEIFRQCKINTNIQSNNLTYEQILMLAKTIKNLTYRISGYFDNNQVFSGGVKLTDLTENLESTKCSNLYFTGEICDVDGVCGGYNLQWAWTSGKIVGESLW